MKQSEKPTLAWAVVSSNWGGRPAVREIISRSPKGARLRSFRWSGVRDLGDFCKAEEIRAEFTTQAKAEAAVTRYNKAWDNLNDMVARARDASTKAMLVFRQAQEDQRASALAAITLTGEPT